VGLLPAPHPTNIVAAKSTPANAKPPPAFLPLHSTTLPTFVATTLVADVAPIAAPCPTFRRGGYLFGSNGHRYRQCMANSCRRSLAFRKVRKSSCPQPDSYCAIRRLSTTGHTARCSPATIPIANHSPVFDNTAVMALVVFLRGVNVGGHRTFRPSLVANQLTDFDVVNIGAAGTFVVRNRISQAKLRAEFLRHLPFQTELAICDGNDILDLASGNPFAGQPAGSDFVRFVSVLTKRGQPLPSTPLALPSDGEWLLKLLGTKGCFVFGVYRREMKAIRYLGQLDRIIGVPVTTRNWNTLTAIATILNK